MNIVKNGPYVHTIFFNGIENETNKIFIDSLLDANILYCSKTNDRREFIQFNAEKVEYFVDFLNAKSDNERKLSYKDTLKLLWCLSQQIFYLEKQEYTFYKIDINKIILIDNERIFYSGFEDIMRIKREKNVENSYIEFKKPFKRNGFLSPEILETSTLPKKISYKTVYFSFGTFIFYCLFNINLDELERNNGGEPIKIDKKYGVNEKIIDLLAHIKYTKLYWFLLRNLSVDAKLRNIFFI